MMPNEILSIKEWTSSACALVVYLKCFFPARAARTGVGGKSARPAFYLASAAGKRFTNALLCFYCPFLFVAFFPERNNEHKALLSEQEKYMVRHFTRIRDLSSEEAHKLVLRAQEMKATGYRSSLLAGKIVVLIFEKASTRTRLSFEVAIRQLGGQTIFMTPAESQLGRSEPLKDTARVLSRYNDGMVVRTFGQEKIDQLVQYGTVPVINALTDEGHPCQIMSDMLTMSELTPTLADLRVAWVGDGNNMANSFIEAAMIFPYTLHLACPEGFTPDAELLAAARAAGAKIHLSHDPREAVAGAHYVHTDVWASMGQEAEQRARAIAFAGYCVNAELMALARPDAKFMHCLPAHRGEEVSEEVFEGPQSIVFDQAENRLHMQKAILEWVYS